MTSKYCESAWRADNSLSFWIALVVLWCHMVISLCNADASWTSLNSAGVSPSRSRFGPTPPYFLPNQEECMYQGCPTLVLEHPAEFNSNLPQRAWKILVITMTLIIWVQACLVRLELKYAGEWPSRCGIEHSWNGQSPSHRKFTLLATTLIHYLIQVCLIRKSLKSAVLGCLH